MKKNLLHKVTDRKTYIVFKMYLKTKTLVEQWGKVKQNCSSASSQLECITSGVSFAMEVKSIDTI